jgi:hypothetical protein
VTITAGANAGPQAGERRLERVAHEQLRILVGRQAVAERDGGRPVHRGPQDVKGHLRVRAGRQRARLDGAAHGVARVADHLGDGGEPLPVLTDARHRAVHEHQLEVLRMKTAEAVVLEEALAHGRERVLGGRRARELEQLAEALLGEREEDVVLAREVAVDRARAVFDALGDPADRDVAVALGDEQLPRGVENAPPDVLTFPGVALLGSHG